MKKRELKLDSILPSECQSDYLPDYVFKSVSVKVGIFWYLYYKILLHVFIKIALKWRLGIFGSLYRKYQGDPDHKEVENIYTREAETYERKHHLTTNFRDTWWRRQIGLEVVNYIYVNKKKKEKIRLLDVGTGIGLSLEEMFRMFQLCNVKVSAVGLDYNQGMLNQAKRVILPRIKKDGLLAKNIREIEFVKGDARNLTKTSGEKGLKHFSKNTFDCVTIMFGIGGVDSQLESMKEQLGVLKLNGVLAILDIHRPFIELDERWPWFIGNRNVAAFNVMAWNNMTKPLVLATLWGWRDPTPTFYTSSLVVDYDKDKDAYYGFEYVSLFVDNESWWFNFPTIPTGKVVLRKVEISKEEFKKRQKVLNNIFS